MRLERLDLTRFGRFTDRVLHLPAPPAGGADLHIIYGPNEAGKSTLFAAWLDLLFGIPLRTRHDFLHPGPTMQIGAQISHAGGTTDLRRVKRNNASLLDPQDAPIAETVLQSMLGGLTRDGYSAMFSLDDETLEKGGDGILASRGDLGEMLFSASAGLAGLAPQLDGIRAELDAFHRTGKRSGGLHDAKKQLAELDRQRREAEVSAPALKTLLRDADIAEADWRAARKAEDDGQAELDRAQDLAATWPLLAALTRLQDQLAPIGHLPDADADMRARFDALDRDRVQARARMADRDLRLQGLDEQLARLTPDAVMLAQTDAVDLAETLRPEHDTALKDLPRRRAEADDARTTLHATLSRLGHAGAAPADLILTAATLGRMRALLTERSGIRLTATTTAAEARRATDHLAQERDRLGDPGPDGDDAALSALIARLRASDPAETRRRAQADRDQAQVRLDSALAALAPWVGDADSLAALTPLPGWQIDAWRDGLETARQQQADATRAAQDLRAELAQAQADAAARTQAQSATGITLADAATARTRREALWAAHRQALTDSSAQDFEQSLREDDRIASLLAEAMADARRDALARSAQDALTARIGRADALAHAAGADHAAAQAAIAATVGALGLHGAALPDLTAWLDLRRTALAERDNLRGADAALARAEQALADAGRALGAALGGADQGYDARLAQATARLDAADRRRETRRQLATLTQNARDRDRAATDASAAWDQWQQDWAEASRDSVLASMAGDDPGLGAALDLLDQLGNDARTLAALDDRIAKMDDNRSRFQTAKAAVLAALDLPDTTPWADVTARLRRAQDDARDRDTLTRQITTEQDMQAQDRRSLTARDDAARAIGAALDCADDDALSAHIDACLTATALRRDIAARQADLAGRTLPADDDTADALRERIDAQRTDQALRRTTTETLHAAYLEARRKLDAVGGDDALARIASDRANLLDDIRDRAQSHLANRLGLLTFEAGLRRFRDQHRSAMLARASDAFCRLSHGAYRGLATQPDGAQEILVAQPAGGGAKLAHDLSKGTRFQLYLALRIAGYHELADSRPTVPFIADDIMETFDDDRSAAAFALLADMSRVGQVIYLTHHRHLCDIARTACPGAHVIDLQAV